MLCYLAWSEHCACRGCDLHIYERWTRACDGDNPGEWGMQSLSSCRERVAIPQRRSQHHSLSSVLPYPAENILGKQCGMLPLGAVLGCGPGGQLQTHAFKRVLMQRKCSANVECLYAGPVIFNHSSQAHQNAAAPYTVTKYDHIAWQHCPSRINSSTVTSASILPSFSHSKTSSTVWLPISHQNKKHATSPPFTTHAHRASPN